MDLETVGFTLWQQRVTYEECSTAERACKSTFIYTIIQLSSAILHSFDFTVRPITVQL